MKRVRTNLRIHIRGGCRLLRIPCRTEQDDQYRHLAGEALSDQTKPLVVHWRCGIIAVFRTSFGNGRTPDGEPLPDNQTIAFAAVMNETIKPYLSARGHTADEVEKMHRAWTKSVPLQVALWAQPYSSDEW